MKNIAALLLCALVGLYGAQPVFAQSQTLVITADNADGAEDFSMVWTSATGTLYADGIDFIGLSFVLTTAIPAGSTIDTAYVRVQSLDAAGTFTVNIGLENVNPATNTIWSGTHFPSTASYVGSGINVASAAYGNDVWYFGSADTYPTNLAADFNTLFASNGPWEIGERINIRIYGPDAAFGTEYLGIQDSSNGTLDAGLALAWTEAGGGSVVPIISHNRRQRVVH